VFVQKLSHILACQRKTMVLKWYHLIHYIHSLARKLINRYEVGEIPNKKKKILIKVSFQLLYLTSLENNTFNDGIRMKFLNRYFSKADQ
jgi:hypothetical protein